MNKLILPFLALFILISCTEQPSIILSKANSSNSCEAFINRLDSTLDWRIVDAYSLSDDELALELLKADGIIMTGGADIHPGRYGAGFDTVRCGAIDELRDAIEFKLLAHVEESHIPCVGFCRGLQIMNVYNGGSLHPHLPDTISDIHRIKTGATSHDIIVLRSQEVLPFKKGSHWRVISNHHQGISQLGDNLEVWAISPDGLYEGIRHSDTLTYPYYVGVQWHPERSESGKVNDELIGYSFINAVKKGL
jgi:putative glutamine amidotransferase